MNEMVPFVSVLTSPPEAKYWRFWKLDAPESLPVAVPVVKSYVPFELSQLARAPPSVAGSGVALPIEAPSPMNTPDPEVVSKFKFASLDLE